MKIPNLLIITVKMERRVERSQRRVQLNRQRRWHPRVTQVGRYRRVCWVRRSFVNLQSITFGNENVIGHAIMNIENENNDMNVDTIVDNTGDQVRDASGLNVPVDQQAPEDQKPEPPQETSEEEEETEWERRYRRFFRPWWEFCPSSDSDPDNNTVKDDDDKTQKHDTKPLPLPEPSKQSDDDEWDPQPGPSRKRPRGEEGEDRPRTKRRRFF